MSKKRIAKANNNIMVPACIVGSFVAIAFHDKIFGEHSFLVECCQMVLLCVVFEFITYFIIWGLLKLFKRRG